MSLSEDPDGLTGEGARWLVESDVRIAVVGAGGWVGMASLELLHRLLGPTNFETRVVAFGSQRRTLALRDAVRVEQQPLEALAGLPPRPTIVLHLAFLTQEKAKAMSEADYVAANATISRRVREALDEIGAIGVFVPSSGAVYMVDDPAAQASMRLYGRLKLEDEAMFAEWAERGDGRRAVIARVFNLSGPFINKQSSYALACFIADALAGRPIHIRASRPVYRSFVAVSELMSVVFSALADATAYGPVSFDTAGEDVLEMGEIAATVRRIVDAGTPITRPPLDSDAADSYVGDFAAYRSLRARAGVALVDFPTQVRTTAAYMSEGSLERTDAAPLPANRSAKP